MRKLAAILGLLAALCAIPAAAQTQFPQTLPANTVWGRTGIGPGPGQAIPFGVLFGNVFGGSVPPAHTVVISEGASPLNGVSCGTALALVGNGASVDPSCQVLTNAGLAAMAANTVKGSIAGGTPTDLTQTQLTSLCNLATGSLSGCVPAWPNTVTTFFRGDGTYATPPTVSASAPGYVPTIPNNTTTFFRGDGTYAAVANAAMVQPVGLNLAARFGSMDVWQRGAGASASIAVAASTTLYTVDGCYLATGANEASVAASVAGIAGGSYRAAALTRNSGQTGTAAVVFGCPFDTDEILLFAGQFVTLSFTASTGANWSPTSGTLSWALFCGTGSVKKQTTGYTGQTTPITTSTNITAGSSAARFQATSGAIVPANCTQAEIQWTWTPTGTAGAADTVTIDDVQLEIAANANWTAAAYQRRDFDEQLNKAQRHFAKTFIYGTAPAQNAGSVGVAYFVSQAAINGGMTWRFPRQMRATPSITTFNPAAANANCRNFTNSTDLTATASAISASTESTYIVCATPPATAAEVGIHFTADAGI
jgi:hypothetical protein